MKKQLKLLFCSMLCVLTCTVQVVAQVEKDMNVEPNFECVSKPFRFLYKGELYKDNKKAFLCPNDLPEAITIVDLDNTPISYNVIWTGINPISSTTHTITIPVGSFTAEEINLNAVFTDENNEPYSLRLRIQKPTFNFKDLNTDTYAFDDNQISQYPTYHTTPPGIPWKFLEVGQMDQLKSNASPNASYYAINIEADDANLVIQPPSITSHNHKVDFSYPSLPAGIDYKEINVSGCGGHTEQKLSVGNPIQKTVNFVYLCQSAGDCPPNIDVEDLLAEANEVLNQSGVYLTLGAIHHHTIAHDNNNDGVFGIIDQTTMHNYYTANPTPYFTSDYLIMIVKDLGSTTVNGNTAHRVGRATGIGTFNTLSIDATNINTGSTIAHEIGHACFKLRHPSDRTVPVTSDNRNFMYYTAVGRTNNIRAYQFQNIHQIR